MISKELCTKFNNAIMKLGSHPAAPSSLYPFNHLIWFSLQEVCSNGLSKWAKHDGITVWYNKTNYKKYKSLFDEKFKERQDKKFARIKIPYKDYYGTNWTSDHVAYWGDINFAVFHSQNFHKYRDIKNWQSYYGPHCSALSYEEMVIKLCNQFFKNYGNKLNEDYLTPEEKQNHKKYSPFKFNETEDGKGYYFDRDKNYIRVTEAELNRRWLKDFVETDYCKKNWSDSFIKILKGKTK